MIRIYYINISDLQYAQIRKDYLSELPQEVITKADRYKNEGDRIRNLMGEVLARMAVSVTTSTFPTEVFRYNPQGKPYLENNPIYFNITHSGDYVAVAVADHEIGIDIEKVRTNKIRVAERFFSQEEIYHIKQSQNPDQYFTRLWSIKEAYLKYIGSGLTKSLNSFTVTSSQDGSHYISSEQSSVEVNIFHQVVETNYFLSVCYHTNETIRSINPIHYENISQLISK